MLGDTHGLSDVSPKLVIDTTTNPLNPTQCLAKLTSRLLSLALCRRDLSAKGAGCCTLLCLKASKILRQAALSADRLSSCLADCLLQASESCASQARLFCCPTLNRPEGSALLRQLLTLGLSQATDPSTQGGFCCAKEGLLYADLFPGELEGCKLIWGEASDLLRNDNGSTLGIEEDPLCCPHCAGDEPALSSKPEQELLGNRIHLGFCAGYPSDERIFGHLLTPMQSWAQQRSWRRDPSFDRGHPLRVRGFLQQRASR